MSQVGKRAIHLSVDSRVEEFDDASAGASDPHFAEKPGNGNPHANAG
jgi:hypothetical protein